MRVLVVQTTSTRIMHAHLKAGERPSETVEMYLQTVYRLRENEGVARTSAIAQSLSISMGAVTNTLTSLERQGLVRRKAYRGVELTASGEAIALRVLRKHRLAERLLTEVLGMKWSEVHEVACRLEHAITDNVVEALERLLKNPRTCPHGNPIPDATGKFRQANAEPLTMLKPAQEAVLVSIASETGALLRYLASLRLIPGVRLEFEEKAPFNGPVMVKVRGSRYALGQQVASLIKVRRI